MSTEIAARLNGPGAGGPAISGGRIESLDVLRGVAVLGILFINISVFALPSGAYTLPGGAAPEQAADFSVWAFNEVFVEGTMRALFSMLFGASMLLMTGVVPAGTRDASSPPNALDLYARRSLWLVGFGLVHAYVLLWPHDILYAYGLLGLLLLPLRVLPMRLLLAAGLVMLGVAALISGLGDSSPMPGSARYGEQAGANLDFASLPEGWADVTPPEEEIRLGVAQSRAQDAIDTRRSGYADNFRDMAPATLSLQTEGFYRTGVFDIGGMMLIGMALFRAGVLTGRRSRRFYWAMLAAGYGAGLVVNGAETWASVNSPEDAGKLIYWSEVTYDLGRLPISLGHVAALMLLMQSDVFGAAARLISAAGRMALTNYVMQTLICNTLFLGAGFGLYGSLRLHQLMVVAVFICVAQIAFSVAWLRRYRMGPLEWALRSLVRWSPQPFRLRAPVSITVAAKTAGR